MDDDVLAPLAQIFPLARDRLAWQCARRVTAQDTHAEVLCYEHRRIGRCLRLDREGRVYGEDPQGVVRLFGRGGAMALAVALNAVFDGMDEFRPQEVALPREETAAAGR